MLELLVDEHDLKEVEPPKMKIGKFFTFKEVENLFGKGQQAVHNSGSSMMDDTPSFATNVVYFLSNHINYKTEYFKSIIENLNDTFLKNQADSLIKFKKDKAYRNSVLKKIFKAPFEFNNDIEVDYLYISIILYFIKKYNYFESSHKAHEVTKKAIKKRYASEEKMLGKYYEKLENEETINYLMDVCYGRYYFLEVHFLEKVNIRNVPRKIVEMFFETGIDKVLDEDYFEEELDDEVEQNKIQVLTGYADEKMVNIANNREPELINSSKKSKYKTNAKLAKTIIEQKEFKCEYAHIKKEEHVTFKTKHGYYVEAHHLIPMSKQSDFLPINIDRSENIVVLCPNCHRAIHNGTDKEKITRLKKLFNSRQKLLSDIGINIEFDKLKEYYKIKK